MNDLDIHVGIHPATSGEWLERCLDSIRNAVSKTNLSVRVYHVPAVEGHIGRMRHMGYTSGVGRYKVFVDDDDYILPNAIQILEPYIAQSVNWVQSREHAVSYNVSTINPSPHHWTVFRRELLIDHRDWRQFGDLAQINAVRSWPGRDLAEVVYVWNNHRNSPAKRYQKTRYAELDLARTGVHHQWLDPVPISSLQRKGSER